jgi:hypothetical protein
MFFFEGFGAIHKKVINFFGNKIKKKIDKRNPQGQPPEKKWQHAMCVRVASTGCATDRAR